jgi:hypothetical protein
MKAESIPVGYFTEDLSNSIVEESFVATSSCLNYIHDDVDQPSNIIIKCDSKEDSSHRLSNSMSKIEVMSEDARKTISTSINLNKNTALVVHISLDDTQTHSLFGLNVKSTDGKYKLEEQKLRFAVYRDFHTSKIEKCSVVLTAKFPETHKKSALGLKLSKEELLRRAEDLNMVSLYYQFEKLFIHIFIDNLLF